MPKKVEVVNYRPEWASEFEALKKVFLTYLSPHILSIEHIGSTSIKGLAAKPILDIDLIIEQDNTTLEALISQLEKLGYHHSGNLGITGREVFKLADEYVPRTGSGRIWQQHHLYVCPANSLALRNHLNFRNYLRQHPAEARTYGALKQQLALQFPYNIDAYIDGKTDFIVNILQKVGLSPQDTQQIQLENKF